ncbi:hypothetical protein [Shewanella gaetbuli]
MSKKNNIKLLAIRFGWLGCFGIAIGFTIVSLLQISQADFSGFLWLQKSMSELGYYGDTDYAIIVNGGLFFGGLSITLACLFALQVTDGWMKYPFWLSLAGSFVAIAASGLFPLNVYHLHIYGLTLSLWLVSFACLSFIIYALTLNLQQMKFSILLALICLSLNFCVLILPYFGVIPSPAITISMTDIIAASASIFPKPDFWWQALAHWLSMSVLILWVLTLLSWLNKSIETK